MDSFEDVLRNLGLFGSGSAAKMIERNAKPLIDFIVDFAVLVADLDGGCVFLKSFVLCRCSILISTTDE